MTTGTDAMQRVLWTAADAAAARAAVPDDATGDAIVVEQPGGELVVDLASPGRAVTSGPAHVVFQGRVA